MRSSTSLFYLLLLFAACNTPSYPNHTKALETKDTSAKNSTRLVFDSAITTIHVFVALCDNRYQGIVPVPAAIGNGQDPNSNLYWGCGYGVRTYFKNSPLWTLLQQYPVDTLILERLIFKHKNQNAYLIADAYNGKYIRQCTIDFLHSCAGQKKDILHSENTTVGSYGNAKLIAYIGHNGLMDFKLQDSFIYADDAKRDAIILACASQSYFWQPIWQTKAYPLIWTTGLMCPEAYTLHDALESYLAKEPVESIRSSAATAYSKYQKCSIKAAKNLLLTGW